MTFMRNKITQVLCGIIIVIILAWSLPGQSGWAENHADASGAAQNAAPAKETLAEVSDLPLYEVPQGKASTDMFGIMISGDGGWWTLDSTVSKVLADHGVPMVGVSSYKYFATKRTPDSTTSDMARVLRWYLKKWNKQRIVLCGYSRGAEAIPFVANRLPEDLRSRVVMVVMIGPAADTNFELHATDWVMGSANRETYPVQPEIEKIQTAKPLCAYSDKDDECICEKLDPKRNILIKRSGDHHFGGDYTGLGEAIWEALSATAKTTPATAPDPVPAPKQP
jgi:type IV secretory pathway VirJ component